MKLFIMIIRTMILSIITLIFRMLRIKALCIMILITMTLSITILIIRILK
jgi:hypothetical protein